jgi:Lon protease-like protein
MDIPLFQLHAVLFPGAALPLHVFEPRYRALIVDCLAAGEPFGVVCITSGPEVGPGRVAFAAVGTLAEIRKVNRYADGRYDIVTVGTGRFRLSGVIADRKPYLVGIGDLLPEIVGDAERTARLARSVRARFVRYLELLQPWDEETQPGPAGEEPDVAVAAGAAGVSVDPAGMVAATHRLEEITARLAPPGDPVALGHVVSGLVQTDLRRRQRLLEATTTEERLADLDALLGSEIALLARRLGPYAPDPRMPGLRRN